MMAADELRSAYMNRLTILIAVILGAGSLAFGQATTMPADPPPVKVLVIPFAQIGNTTGHEWVGAAIQESLMNEAAGNTTVWAVSLDRPLARGDMSQVTAAAKGTGATLVVFGAYQYSDSQLRVTGEVVDVNYGRVLGTLKATGALIDLFKIEDSLSAQLQALLPQPPSNLPVVVNGPPDQSAVPGYAGDQPVTVAAPTTTYVYQSPPVDYSTNYVYTSPYYYGYGYPYYYGGYPVIIGGGFGPRFYPRGFFFRGGPVFRGGGGFRGGGFHGGIGGGHR
jgi:TolB-like protein